MKAVKVEVVGSLPTHPWREKYLKNATQPSKQGRQFTNMEDIARERKVLELFKNFNEFGFKLEKSLNWRKKITFFRCVGYNSLVTCYFRP